MSPGKALRGVALGLLGHFVSRNNDIDGYWAIGKLYALAPPDGRPDLHIDLLRAEVATGEHAFRKLVAGLRQRLHAHLARLQLPPERVSSAAITLVFNVKTSIPMQFPTAPEGDAFECTVELVDDLGKAYRASTSGRRWRHDALRESRSARAEPVRL